MAHAHHEGPPAPPPAPPVSPDAVAVRHGRVEGIQPHHLYKTAGLVFLLALAFKFFDQIAQVFLLTYAAGILAVALNALLQKLPLHRKAFAAITGLLVVGAVVALFAFGAPLLIEQARSLAQMGPGLEQQVREWEVWIRQTFGLNVELPSLAGGGQLSAGGTGGSGTVLGTAVSVAEALFIPIVVFFGALFALANPNDRLMTPLLRAVRADLRPAFYRIFQLLGERLVGWLKGTGLAMLAVGVLSVLTFWLIGVPNALLLGIFNGLVEFIPLVGPWVGGLIAVLIAFMDDPTKALWVAMAALAIQQIEANVITPFAMSQNAEIHPFITLFALLLFGGLFGFLGLFLALPLTLLTWTVVQVLWVERAIDTDRDRIAPVVRE